VLWGGWVVVLGVVFYSFPVFSIVFRSFPLFSLVFYRFPSGGQLWESLGLQCSF